MSLSTRPARVPAFTLPSGLKRICMLQSKLVKLVRELSDTRDRSAESIELGNDDETDPPETFSSRCSMLDCLGGECKRPVLCEELGPKEPGVWGGRGNSKVLGSNAEMRDMSPSSSCTFTIGGDPVGGVVRMSLKSLTEKRNPSLEEEDGIVKVSPEGAVSLRKGGSPNSSF